MRIFLNRDRCCRCNCTGTRGRGLTERDDNFTGIVLGYSCNSKSCCGCAHWYCAETILPLRKIPSSIDLSKKRGIGCVPSPPWDTFSKQRGINAKRHSLNKLVCVTVWCWARNLNWCYPLRTGGGNIWRWLDGSFEWVVWQ